MAAPALVAFGGALVVLGAVVTYAGYRSRREARELAATETSAIADVDPDAEGRVVVEGEARVAGAGTLPAPIAGTDGVVVRTEVEQRERPSRGTIPLTGRARGGDVGGRGPWTTETETFEHVPFRVEDGTGSALVELPDAAEVVLDQRVVPVGRGETPPPPVREYLETAPAVTADASGRRRYSQGVVEPGESVSLLAEPVGTGGSDADVMLGGETAPERVVLSDRPASELADARSGIGLLGCLLGGLLALAGLVVVALALLAGG